VASKHDSVKVYTTARDTTLRLSLTHTLEFAPKGQPLETEVSVFVNPDKKFQAFFGIGAALTDAAAETFYKLPEEVQEDFLRAYFDKEHGLGYTLARTNINSCDFSSASYTYVDDGDKTLASFDIGCDRKHKIPFIKAATKAAGGHLTLYASPWSPPAWMKSNHDVLQGGTLLPEYNDTWARYFAKFIKAYEEAGIPIWGVTVQNEPMATQRWESCLYTAEQERDFIKHHLGPTLTKEGLADKKIIAWDHNRDLILQRAQTYLDDPETARHIWGIGFHWYEDWSGGQPMYDNIRRVHEAYPETNLLFTEGAVEDFDPTRLNAWELGEEYGRSMISDFNNGATGFTDWNILLDETGGPNHVRNFCFASSHGDTRTGELTHTNIHHYIGHFSKFIRPGARRVTSSSSRSHLLTTAFTNPDGTTAVVVMNQSDLEIPYLLWVKGRAVSVEALPRSITTLVF